jgi:hypothetical protein
MMKNVIQYTIGHREITNFFYALDEIGFDLAQSDLGDVKNRHLHQG